MASRVAALLLLGVLCFSFAAGEIAVDCCLQTIDKRVPPKNIKQYIIQEAGKGCDISATVLFTIRDRTLCVPHPNEKSWVENLIKNINKKNNHNSK